MDATDSFSMTPLMYAAGNGHTECVRLLVQRGADVYKRGDEGGTAAHYAAWKGYEEALLALLDAGCEIDATDSRDMTPLMWAACNGHVECVQLLIQRGADVNKRDKEGLTAAHCAALCGKLAALQTLLAFDTDVLSLPGLSVADCAAEHFQVDALLYTVACGCRLEVPRRLDAVAVTFPFCSLPL